MLCTRLETSGRSETLGRAVNPRLRTTAGTGSTRHQQVIVTHCSRTHLKLTQGKNVLPRKQTLQGSKDGLVLMRCKLAQTLAFARSMIFNTKNAIVLSLQQARMEYEISHAYLGKKGRL
jgi:hypothetical protein